MRAYIIATREETTDPQSLARYDAEVPKSRVDGMKPLVLRGRVEALEGPTPEAVVVLEFPDWDAAKAWYDSPAYQQARDHRLAGGKFRLLLAEGL